MKKNIIRLIIFSSLTLGIASCSRFLDIAPVGVAIPKTLEDYRALITRAYGLYPAHRAMLESRTDNTTLNTSSSSAPSYKDLFLWNEANPDPATIEIPYEQFYSTIFYTNHIINNGPKDLPEGNEKNQIIGEAYALRAYCFFELANIYAPEYSSANSSLPAIPVVTEVDLERDYSRASLQQVYDQIFSDISNAEKMVNVTNHSAGLNYRFSIAAVKAFKARVYQYMGDWQNALAASRQVLDVNNKLEDFNAYAMLPSNFKSVESIMNLDVNLSSPTQSLYFASQQHLALYDQANDLRFAKYFRKSGSMYQSTKYQSSNELKSTFRVGEIILLKAEAEARLNKIAESKETLLVLAKKRYNTIGYTNFSNKISGLTGESYLNELYSERNRELSFEGLRWFDLRRTSKPEITHQYNAEAKVLQKNDARYTLPFPKSARLRNPKL